MVQAATRTTVESEPSSSPGVGVSSAKPARTWRELLDDAFASLELSATYADDGAYLTAANLAERAAGEFREGARVRLAAMQATAR